MKIGTPLIAPICTLSILLIPSVWPFG